MTPDTPAPPALLGGCQCGAVRYAISGPLLTFYACHCRDCQQQSASAFGLSIRVKADDFVVTLGTPVFFETRGDSGASKTGSLCAQCGSRLFNRDGAATRSGSVAPDPDAVLSVKGGTLDRIGDFSPVSHIWIRSAQPWIRQMIESACPDVPCWDGEPDDERLVALWQQSGQT